MADTIRERLAAALKTRLLTLTGVTVARAPQSDFAESELPALGLFMGDERRQDSSLSGSVEIAERRMEVLIVGHAKGASGEAAETAAHDLYGRAVIAVLADHTQGGLAIDTREAGLIVTANAGAEGETPLCGFELSLEVDYWTRAADPTALAP